MLAGLVAGGGDGFENDLNGFFVRFAARREAAFVADGRRVAMLLQRGLQRVEDFHSPAQGFRKARGAHGHNHELLEVHGTVGMRTTVENVHHRAGEEIRGRIRGIAGKILVERLFEGDGGGAGGSHGHGEDGVGAEPGLGGRAIEGDHSVIEGALVGGVETGDGFGDFGVGVGNGLEHALAEIFRFVTVAELEGFVLAGRSAGGDGGAAKRSAIKDDVGFDGGIAARIDDLAGVDFDDLSGHGCLFSWVDANR